MDCTSGINVIGGGSKGRERFLLVGGDYRCNYGGDRV